MFPIVALWVLLIVSIAFPPLPPVTASHSAPVNRSRIAVSSRKRRTSSA